MKLLTLILTLLFLPSLSRAQSPQIASSPDGNVRAIVSTTDEGHLQYRVEFKGTDIIEPSRLGITVDGVNLGSAVELSAVETSVVDQRYATRGNHNVAHDHCNVVSISVTHKSSERHYTLEFRAYDDGVAYRYVVPSEETQHVDRETSSWKILKGAKVWYFERLTPGWKLKSYAGEWMSTKINQLETATPKTVGPVQGTPLVFELPRDLGYAAITKAALYNYSGMRLKAVGDRTVMADFPEGEAGFDVEGTITTPWHVTLLADDLNELVNSDLITNLNPAPDAKLFADSSFVKPGRSAWSWETLGLGSPQTQRDFIDLAAELGFEYSIIDDGWKDWDKPWETIRSLCDHGRTKNVGVWIWTHSDDISQPRNDYQQMKDYFGRVANTGAVGLKIDFMNGETKALVDFEIAALRIAAKNRLMINFHGCHASTGEERTWPNEMTREGIRGIEVNKMGEGPLPASHNAALPFTRFIVGHADYTPVLYTNPGPTTWAHQLANAVVFTSPLQVYAEHPETMMKMPILRNAREVLSAIPTVWDETIVLPRSKIGTVAAFARRSGEQWFVGILNGGDQRNFDLDLSFLPEDGFDAVLISDDTDGEPVNLVGLNKKARLKQYTTAVPFKVTRQLAKRSETLKVKLSQGGGCVLMLSPRK